MSDINPELPSRKTCWWVLCKMTPIESDQTTKPKDKGAFIRSGLQPGPCMSEVMVSLIAGNDTTAAAIRMTMLAIITNPRVYSKLKTTVKEAILDGRASHPIKQEEAKRIPYIQVC